MKIKALLIFLLFSFKLFAQCDTVNMVTATSVSYSTATINFVTPNAHINYVIVCNGNRQNVNDPGGPYPHAVSAGLTGLTPSTLYTYYIVANCSGPDSALTSNKTFTTTAPTCDSVTGITVSVTNSTATINSAEATYGNTYTIFYVKQGFTDTLSETGADGDFSLSALKASTVYAYRIRTNCTTYSDTTTTGIRFFTTSNSPAYVASTTFGYQDKRFAADSTLNIPTFSGAPTLRGGKNDKSALAYDSTAGRGYFFNPKTQTFEAIPAASDSVAIVDNVSAMQAYTLSKKIIFNRDSIRGGRFNLVYDTTLTDDNGIYFAASGIGSGYHWQRDYTGPVHARWFATTSNDSNVNNASILRAIFAKYKNVMLDKGDIFYVRDSVRMSLDSTIFDGNGGVLRQRIADSGNSFIYVTGQYSTIKNLTLNGTLGDGTAPYAKERCGIQLNADHCTVDNCVITKQSGVIARGTNYTTVRNCTFYYTQKAVFVWADTASSGHDVSIINNYATTIQGVANNSAVRGFKTQNIYNINVIGNTSIGAQLSIELYNSNPANVSGNANVVGNICDTWVSLVTGTANVTGNTVDYALRPTYHADSIIGGINNIVGIEVAAADNFTITGNTIKNNPGEAIFGTFVNQGTTLADNITQTGTITGNTIYNCGDSVDFFKSAITLGNAANIVIANNQGRKIFGNFIAVGGKDTQFVYNIKIFGNQVDTCYGRGILTYYSKDVIIEHNTLKHVKLEGISIGSANTVRPVVRDNVILNGNYYGIAIGGAAFEYECTGNILHGNSSDYKDNSQVSIQGVSYGRFYKNIGTALIAYGSFNPPTTGTFLAGEEFNLTPNTAGTLNGKIVTVSGTYGTLSGVTGSINTGDSILTLNGEYDKITEGQYITVAGVTGPFKIVNLSANGTVLKLNGTADATVSGATVQFYAPTLIDKVSDDYIVRGGIEEGGTQNFNSLPNYSFLKSIGNVNINAPLDTTNYWFLYNLRHRMGKGDGTNYGAQIAIPFGSTSMWFRTQNVGTWGAWRNVYWLRDTLTVSNATGEKHTFNDVNAYVLQSGTAKWVGQIKNYTFGTTGTGTQHFIKYQLAGVDKWSLLTDGSFTAEGTGTIKTIADGTAGTDSLLVESAGLIKKISPAYYTTGSIDSPSHTYGGTLTWDGTAPTTIAAQTYRWSKSGTRVYFRIAVSYTNAGATNTTVSLTFPSDMPAPEEPTGFTTNNDFDASVSGYMGTSTSATNVATRAFIYKIGTGSYGVKLTAGSMSAKTVWVWGWYFTP